MIVIERYQQVSLLAQGGMGKVWLVHDRKTSRYWAMKEIVDTMGSQEAIICEKIHHHAIPSLIDVFKEEGKLYIVMQLIEGIPLSRYIQRYGKSSVKEVLDWTLQLLDILRYLHEHNIIYCDLKPENIILSNKQKLYLIDFGTATFIDSQNSPHYGTIGYASPEQYEDALLDERVDIYGIGRVMLALLCGVYKGEDFQNMDISQSKIKGGTSIVKHCLYENREERYQNVKQLQRAICNYQFRLKLYNKLQCSTFFSRYIAHIHSLHYE